MAVELRHIEQTSGAGAAAEAFAAFAASDPSLAAQAVCEFEQDKVDGRDSSWTAPDDPYGEDVREVYANPDVTSEIIHQGNEVLGDSEPAAVDAYTAALSDCLLDYGAVNNTLLYFNVASDIAGSGSEALQRSFVDAGLQAADASLGDSGDPFSEPVASFLSALGHVASQSPTVARDVFTYTQSHDLGSAEAGTAAFESVLQIFATDGTVLPSGQVPTNSLQPSYLDYMDALLGSGAVQGDLTPQAALDIFTTVSTSGEVWPTGVTLLEQGGVDDGSRGTAQMAGLFEAYMPHWIGGASAGTYTHVTLGVDGPSPSLVARPSLGIPIDRYDSAFINFMNEALFDPNENGAYREPLMASMVGIYSDLVSGNLAGEWEDIARGRLIGGLLALLDQSFDKYADQIRGDAAAQKQWQSFAIGLGFALAAPELKGASTIAKVMVSQGMGQSENFVVEINNKRIDADVQRRIGDAAAEAVGDGNDDKLIAVFEELGLSPEGVESVRDRFETHSLSLNNGKLTMGELFSQIFIDTNVVPNVAVTDGIELGWTDVQQRFQ